MELFALNELLQPERIIDQFSTLIWTERYSEWGDFELVIDSSLGRQSALARGSLLGLDKSRRVMMIETVDEPGDGTIKLTGRSLEALLSTRIVNSGPAVAGNPGVTVTVSSAPAALARSIFEQTCQTNTLIPADNFSFVKPGSAGIAGNIPEPIDVIEYQYAQGTVYDTIKAICDPYQLGFAIVRDVSLGGSLSYFDVYSGSDRSGWQTTLPAVIFSVELDTLEKPSYLESDVDLRNVAYVFAEKGSQIVYSGSYDPDSGSYGRRVMMVDASDVTLNKGSLLDQTLQFRGMQALAEQRSVIVFDGEIPSYLPYIYGVDYNLGDFVERRDSRGFASKMLVTEQIFVSDATGERSYPTLTALDLIPPGSWYAWPRTGNWDAATGTWNTV